MDYTCLIKTFKIVIYNMGVINISNIFTNKRMNAVIEFWLSKTFQRFFIFSVIVFNNVQT